MHRKSSASPAYRQLNGVEADGVSYGSPEVVGVLPTEDELEAAVDELSFSGFDRQQISVLAYQSKGAERGGTSAKFPPLSLLEDDPHTRLGAFVSSDSLAEIEAAAVGVPIYAAAIGGYAAVVASGGSLALALAALLLAGTAGGTLRGFLAHTISQHHRDPVAAQLANGGLLLWVQARNLDQENKALQVLHAHHGRHVHVHHLKRAWGTEDVPFHNAQPDPFSGAPAGDQRYPPEGSFSATAQ
ncbi:general stress protein (plasmid) [Ensifer sp. D2-11]